MINNPDLKHDPVDTRPFLFIPYWTKPLFPGDPGDNGSIRPLPNGVISWLCEGIHSNPYVPGQPLEVWVDVGNSGPGNTTSLATVLVYWAEPVIGGISKPKLFGARSVPVPPRGGVVTTPVMTGTLGTSSTHVCLFALVTHDLDKPGSNMDPINDRHWAQHNLIAMTVKPKNILHLPFEASNPLSESGIFEVVVRPMYEREMETLALELKATPRLRLDSLRVQLLDNTGKTLTNTGPSVTLTIELEKGKGRGLHLNIQLDESLEQHEFAAIEVSLNHRFGDCKELVGSLGVVMRPEVCVYPKG
ncbi:hypothetical protein AT278_17865 [Bacillus cereus]|uniref:hypothetical protein n=1 Tax=Bacillus TaxID=1386 RepID=UPI00077AD653|nr:hypothetical protein [Bacillus cereus]KXY55068.1 hypothetical protein AT278_17865 [Bacillus cereus]